FFARIHEQIRNRWIDNLRALVNSASQSELSKWSDHPQITEFEVLLTPEGKYVRTIIFRQADNHAIDSTSISAIRLAALFTNPPSEIVEPDGFVHLRYLFQLEFRPSLFAGGNH